MFTKTNISTMPENRRISLVDSLDTNSKKYLLLDNFEKLYKKRDSLTTRKINVIEEKLKNDSFTSRFKKLKFQDNNNHCLYGKECIYYKKYMKLKKEVESILNANNKLYLFNKSLFSSLEQKTKDYQYLMKENSVLKKALMKLNGISYNELIKNKIKDFKTNSNILQYRNINNNNDNKLNNYINTYSTNYSKRKNRDNLNNINKYNKQKNESNKININENEKKNNNKLDLSSSDTSLDNSFFKNNKSYNLIKKFNNKNISENKNKNKILSLTNPSNIKKVQINNDIIKRIITSPYKRKQSDMNLKFQNSPNKHYKEINKFHQKRGRSSTIFTLKFSLLSLSIDLSAIMNSNDNMNKLESLIETDEHYLSSIQNSSENQLLKYSDLISGLINDYKEMIKLGMRMKDFMKSSLLLVDSIISNNSSKVFIDNTCHILNCDRASLFLLDPVSDSLIIISGEGIKRAQIKVPKDKGIVGACFMEGKKIRIDDAYTDQRFNKDVDIRTNYRTKSILCYPLVDNDGKCFGVIEAINKFNMPFNDDDEELLKLLSHQASTIFKNSIFNDNNKFYIKKLFLLIEYCNKIFHVNNLKEFSEKTEDVLLNLYNCVNSAIFFIENENIIKYNKDKENKKIYKNNVGIVGKVFKSKEIMAFENINNSIEFNNIIDLESPSGLLAFPVLTKKTKNVCAIIEVPFAGDINNSGKPKENEVILIKYLSKCIKNWIFRFNNEKIK